MTAERLSLTAPLALCVLSLAFLVGCPATPTLEFNTLGGGNATAAPLNAFTQCDNTIDQCISQQGPPQVCLTAAVTAFDSWGASCGCKAPISTCPGASAPQCYD